ncbi:MAG TPA: APC family permease [Anaerolineales bacterium]|nr:APC family permease [Anaerolineales bacterium]
MLARLKNALIGTPLPTGQLAEKRLNKIRALAAFSPDALSSIAYANQEIYLGLLVAGSAGLGLAWPIGIAITLLLVMVAISYYQTIQAYPSGGGSYVVARENLGTLPGLIAAAALLIDYLLTAAVSLTAGVESIASAFPVLYGFRIEIALALLAIMTIANLRGLRETGTLMAIPVYLFLFTYLPMLIYGAYQLFTHGNVAIASVAPPAIQPLTLFLILHTFATGCTALTGIEAISNGVPAFKSPETKNAGRTLIVMAILMGILFAGSIGLTQHLGIIAGQNETILSALARKLLGSGAAYVLIQFSTMLILAVAANTSFAGFPRLAAILAKDGFLPRQLTGLGDRLVFANGIVSLSVATGVLIILFGGHSHLLIPLFAVGVFMAFTLSQAGMVRHWWRERGKNLSWLPRATINGFGALATFATLLIVGISKFTEGAWIIVLLIPIFVIAFRRIRYHYKEVSHQLSLRGLPPDIKPTPPLRVVVPISGVHRGIIDAMDLAQSISKNVTAVYVELEPGVGKQVLKEWKCWWPDVPLVILPSPFRSIIRPLLDYLDEDDLQHNDGTLAAVVLPEFIPARWWQALLHNQTTLLIRAALLYRRRTKGFQRIIIDVPYHLKK